MKQKGVSAIIATILLVMIAIALVGTAYIYFSGMIGGRTKNTISLTEAYCNGTHITLAVSNDGTVDLSDEDIQILVDNNDRSDTFTFSGMEPHNVEVVTGTTEESAGEHTVLVVTSSNSVRQVVSC
jgi:flagellin-like protein